MQGSALTFEIAHEARIGLETPAKIDAVCGIATPTPLDLAASKLLSNPDQQADGGVFSRAVIVLATMGLRLPLLRKALAACRTLGAASEKAPQRDQFLPDLQAHSLSMGQKAGENAVSINAARVPKVRQAASQSRIGQRRRRGARFGESHRPHLEKRHSRLERCMQAMTIAFPRPCSGRGRTLRTLLKPA